MENDLSKHSTVDSPLQIEKKISKEEEIDKINNSKINNNKINNNNKMVEVNSQNVVVSDIVRDVKMKNSKINFDDMPIDDQCTLAIRCISPMLPELAKSGHPGAPMGCSAIAHTLFGKIMNYNSSDHSSFWNRDRFVLSNGHASALQYTMLHLSGYPVSIDDLKSFRQLHSICPGHPEAGITSGVEVSTGPLGQGIANSVGLALASKHLAAKYNKPNFKIFDNHVFCLCGDGCLQEGVSSEASSLAGTMALGNLIVLYDSNSISIDGCTDISFTEDVAKRYEAYGWQVLHVDDGTYNVSEIEKMIEIAKAQTSKPSLIICKTVIGALCQKEGSEKCHGAPIGLSEIKKIREQFGMNSDENDLMTFPKTVMEFYEEKQKKNYKIFTEWKNTLQEYATAFPDLSKELIDRFNGNISIDTISSSMPKFSSADKPNATRNLSEIILNICNKYMPQLVGGSADLTDSNKTALKGELDFNQENPAGKYIRYGVREHGMMAITNGLWANGGFKPFCATFLVFSSYLYGALRVSALSQTGILFIATHDSIELGEDGPTHQPIESLSLMRSIPNLLTIRPSDGNEVVGSYLVWLMNQNRPTVIALCRSSVPHFDETSADKVKMGAYIFKDFENKNKNKIIVAGSGSDLHIAVKAAKMLESDFDCRVVSFPCWELFNEQPKEYRDSIFPKGIRAAYFEAGCTFGWDRYFDRDLSVGIDSFGASAPASVLLDHFGFTAEKFAAKIKMNYNC